MPARRRTTRRSSTPRRLTFVPVRVSIADGAVAPGTTRLTDLGALLETPLGDDIAGMRIGSVRGQGSHISTAGGIQTYVCALFVGPATLDAADVLPASSAGGIAWWTWMVRNHRGQQHNVLAAASEFTEKNLVVTTRGVRRIPMTGSTLWFAEETLTQSQNTAWTFTVRGTRA